MRVYIRLLKYISKVRTEVLFKALLGIFISATYIAQAIFMSKAVETVWNREPIAETVVLVGFVLFFVLLRSVLSYKTETYTKVLAARIKSKLRFVVLEKIYALGPGAMNAKRTGKITSLILDGIESLEPFFVNYVPMIISVSLSTVFIFAYLCMYDLVGSIILLISTIICIVVPLFTIPIVNKNVKGYWTDYAEMTSEYIDTVQGITTLKTLNAEENKGEALRNSANAFYKRSVHNTDISLSNSALMFVLSAITSGITVVIVAYRCSLGLAPATAVTAFLFLAGESARCMTDLNRQWHNSFLGLSVANELVELVEKNPDVTNCENPDTTSFDSDLPSIELCDVTFSYPGGAQAVKDVSFTANSGQTVAVVGPSGAGKSTILNLLLRFYDVSAGKILINGVDIRNFELDYLRKNISVVFQDTYLFRGTIRENIQMGRPEASDEEMFAAAKAANIHEFISSLPDGYDTIVGERGTTLSGGERQRISIARAILKDAPILLLDEATSSVDAESESLIQKSLFEFAKNKTTIIIAHRLSTIQNADVIFCLENGELVESGTHDTLQKTGGIYAKLLDAGKEVDV